MGKKKKNIILNILFIFLFLFFTVFMQSVSYANEKEAKSSETVKTQSDQTVEQIDNLGLGNLNDYKGSAVTSGAFKKKVNVIFSAIRIAGTVLSVVILIVIGIKYMLGSVEEKADYKKTMMPYIYGTFFLFVGSLIPQIIYEFVKNIGW